MRTISESLRKYRDVPLMVGVGAAALGVNLVVMILVQRFRGEAGLGIFSYLISLYFVVGFLSEFGIPRYVENEIALSNDNGDIQSIVVADAFKATLFVSLFCTLLIFLSSAYNTASTRVGERIAAYLIIGVTIPFRNINGLRLAFLEGSGRHDRAARQKIRKYLVLTGTIFLLLVFNVPPSYLMLGFFISELFVLITSRGKTRLPSMKPVWEETDHLISILRKTYRYILSEDALDAVFYIDFLVLGLFISSWDLGLYAGASILARFFLLIPVSMRPIFLRQYSELVSQGENALTSISIRISTAVLFYIHSLLGLYILLYYPGVLHSLFHARGEELISFRIFTVLLPGLLFFSIVTAQEPLYGVQRRIKSLQKLILLVTFTNLALNLYLIPFAGFYGAATATTISMLLYFCLFGRHLDKMFRIDKMLYLLAGAEIYLVYMIFHKLDFGFLITFWLIPIVLFILFSVINLFHFEKGYSAG